jgi:hypothetical protein
VTAVLKVIPAHAKLVIFNRPSPGSLSLVKTDETDSARKIFEIECLPVEQPFASEPFDDLPAALITG